MTSPASRLTLIALALGISLTGCGRRGERFVTVEPGVKLQVLDYGGTGRPVVLLAGLGATASGFADFAAKLTPSCHVYAITRRGFPPSSVPDSGYGVDRLADDVIAVIDALRLDRPVLIGHSIAGEELSSIGTRYPAKVAGLVYLDAGYAYALYDEANGNFGFDADAVMRDLQEMASPARQRSAAAIVKDLETSLPVLERDVRTEATLLADLPDQPPPVAGANRSTPAAAILAGQRKFTTLHVPVLAIFALPHDLGKDFRGSPDLRAKIETWDLRQTGGQADAFERQVPGARVVRIPHAAHMIYVSNEAEVLREVNRFIGGL